MGRTRAVWGSLLAGLLVSVPGPTLAQQCQITGTNQTCTNDIALTGGINGLVDSATATVTNNSGASITGADPAGGFGIRATQDVRLTNFGTVSATGNQSNGVQAAHDAIVVNSGSITADGGIAGAIGIGINATNNAIVTNSGTISGSSLQLGIGVVGFQNVNLTNSGTISAGSGIGGQSETILAGVNASVTNSGTIASAGGGALSVSIRGVGGVDVTNSGNISATLAGQTYGVMTDNGTARVVNSGSISATNGTQVYGVAALAGTVDVTNSGLISASQGDFAFGILAGQDARVVNSGTIRVQSDQQTIGINAGRNANVVNSGNITASVSGTGFSYGVAAVQDAAVTNAGTIISAVSGAGRGVGIFANSNAAIVNSGTIIGSAGAGGQGIGIQVFGPANVTNSGIISGSTAALDLSGSADTLTVLPGSRIIGAINLGGGGDSVNFRGGNHNLTFDTLAGATVTGTTPFVVSGNRAVAIDATPFAAAGRNLNDFSRAVLDAVPAVSGSSAPVGGPLAFAAPDASSRVEDAFAAIPGLSAYSGQGLAFKNPTVVYGDGSAVWARGFAGQRIQQQDGVLLRTANLFYGGMIGGDWRARPDLRLGVFLGAGQTRSAVDFNQGASNADLVFGGAYARYDIGASYVHAAVQAGGSRNAASRTINNNLVAGGLETASATYDGWYVSPEATFGHRWALGQFAGATYTLTPSFRLRYLYGSYAGYTETGTTAPLTVSGQTVSTLEERGEARLTRSVTFSPGAVLSTSLTAGVLGTQRVGGNTVNAALLGQAIPFATPGQSNVWGGYGGLGLDWQTGNVTLFSAAEYLALSDRSTVVSGRAGLRVAF
jgi:hypothetical protein